MDQLGDQGLLLSSAPLGGSDTVELGPTAAGPDTLQPLPNMSAEAFFLDETGQWRPFNPLNYEARTVFSEGAMAFSAFRLEAGMVLLSGPGGHRGRRAPVQRGVRRREEHQGADRRQRDRANDQLAAECGAPSAAVRIPYI
jgi:hypothetical protein